MRISEDSLRLRKAVEDKSLNLRDIATRFGAKNLRVFGSVARGDSNFDSDIDFIVDSLSPENDEKYDWVGFVSEIEETMKPVKVDVVNREFVRDRWLPFVPGKDVFVV
ncbi:MAG: nucleotidyltransferase domain-containing protein [Candidatus Ancillula sp.]|nr:nucleotidyltransferase domain-containing protein [Candidatus Ancillula sp.]